MPQRGGGIQAHVMRSARFELNANCLVALLLLARLLPDMSAVPAISPWGEVHEEAMPTLLTPTLPVLILLRILLGRDDPATPR